MISVDIERMQRIADMLGEDWKLQVHTGLVTSIQFHHIDGLQIEIEYIDKTNQYCFRAAYYHQGRCIHKFVQDDSDFKVIKISAAKAESRIKKELISRLINVCLPIYQEVLARFKTHQLKVDIVKDTVKSMEVSGKSKADNYISNRLVIGDRVGGGEIRVGLSSGKCSLRLDAIPIAKAKQIVALL